jgi:hypothetical protein
MKDSFSPSSIEQAITGLAVILVAGTLILPFAEGASIGTGSSNTFGIHVPGDRFTVLDTTNLSLPPADWLAPGPATYTLSGLGSGPFIDPGAGTNQPQQFYRVRWP